MFHLVYLHAGKRSQILCKRLRKKCFACIIICEMKKERGSGLRMRSKVVAASVFSILFADWLFGKAVLLGRSFLLSSDTAAT